MAGPTPLDHATDAQLDAYLPGVALTGVLTVEDDLDDQRLRIVHGVERASSLTSPRAGPAMSLPPPRVGSTFAISDVMPIDPGSSPSHFSKATSTRVGEA